MRPPGPTVQRGRFGFQFFIEVLSSAHAKTWIDCAAFWGGRGRSRKKGRAGYSGSRAIEDDDRAVCADTLARGSFGFVRRRSPSAGKTGGGREDRQPYFHAAILERGFGTVPRAPEGKEPLGSARLDYFWINKGPWSEIDEYAAFLPEVPARKLRGANFYPEDMTKEEFENWV